MPAPPWQRELQVAQSAALQAARLTKKVLATVSEVSKEDSSPVTVADFAAQALIIAILRQAFPGDAFVGEEDAAVLRRERGLRERVYDLFADAVADAAELQRQDQQGQQQGQQGQQQGQQGQQQGQQGQQQGQQGQQQDQQGQQQDQGQQQQQQQQQGTGPPRRFTVDEMLHLIDLGGRGEGGARGRVWVMDPVDGTATFLRGEQYAVSLALLVDGDEALGVVVCPNLRLDDAGRIRESAVDARGLGLMLSAASGQGAAMTRLPAPDALLAGGSPPAAQPLEPLEPPPDLAHAHIIDCALNPAASRSAMQRLADRLGAPFPGTDVWSSHVRYAALMVGGGDVLVRIPSKPGSTSCIWDHAGAQLIFRELGGTVTDLDGRPIDFGCGRHLGRNRGLLAARKDIHGAVLAIVQELMPDR